MHTIADEITHSMHRINAAESRDASCPVCAAAIAAEARDRASLSIADRPYIMGATFITPATLGGGPAFTRGR